MTPKKYFLVIGVLSSLLAAGLWHGCTPAPSPSPQFAPHTVSGTTFTAISVGGPQGTSNATAFLTANLPASGSSPGRLFQTTDGLRSLFYDTGSYIVPVTGGVYYGASWGIKADGATDNSTALQTVLSAINTAGGGTLILPGPGSILYGTGLNLSQFTNISIVGVQPGNQTGTSGQTNLVFTGTGAGDAINLQSARAIHFKSLGLQWNNASFTGYLIDAQQAAGHGNTTNIELDDCTLSGTNSGNWTSTAALIVYDGAFNCWCKNTRFQGGASCIIGRLTSTGFNNTIRINGCYFGNSVNAAIRNPHQSWDMQGNVFEPTSGGAAGALSWDSTVPGYGMVFRGNWLGDDNSTQTGSWITVSASSVGIDISDNNIGTNNSTTAVKVAGNSVSGLTIRNNRFVGNNGSNYAVDFTGTTGHTGVDLRGNNYFQLTNKIKGITNPASIFTSAIYDTGGVTTHIGPQYAFNPNGLSTVNADIETGTGQWGSNLNATLARTTAFALHGTHSMSVSATAAGTEMSVALNNSLPTGLVAATPGLTYTAQAAFFCDPASTPRNIVVNLYAYDSAGNNGTLVANQTGLPGDNKSTWNTISATGACPATVTGGGAAAYVGLVIRWTYPTNIPMGEVHYFDCAQIVQGSRITWLSPAWTSAQMYGPILQSGSGSDLKLLPNGSGTFIQINGETGGSGGTILHDGIASQVAIISNGHMALPTGFPTIAAGTGAGNTSTVSISGSDHAGTITVTTGSGPTASATVLTVTFGTAYGATPRAIVLTPAEPNAAALSGNAQVYEDVASRSATLFNVNVGSGGLGATTTYKWTYWVIG